MTIYRSLPEIRPAGDADHPALVKFLNHQAEVHQHLDWRAPLEWLGSQPFLIAAHEQTIQAVLACPPDPEKVAWIRLFAALGPLDSSQYFRMLLDEALVMLDRLRPGCQVVAIGLEPWFQNILAAHHFCNLQSIVVLEWTGDIPQAAAPATDIRIRPMHLSDLPCVRDVDKAAFEPVWHNSLETLSLAFQQSAWSTVAEDSTGSIIGYQISTAIPLSGHLARLAVLPELQRGGIAFSLVRDLMVHFRNRGAWRVTVNTQDNNFSSLALYHKMGFRNTGETFPVFTLPED